MANDVRARLCFAVTAACVLTGLAIQLDVSAGLTGTQFTSTTSRIVNVFCYFTVQSNLIVGVTTLLLALRLDRPSTVFRVFRLAGLIGITVTGIVFHVALRQLQDLQGSAAVADFFLHTAVPVLAPLGWLLFGPRGTLTGRVAALSALYPVAWLAMALIRGAAIDFYPYPFVDVRVHGYLTVAGNCVLVAALFLALAFGAVRLDAALPRRGRQPLPDRSPA